MADDVVFLDGEGLRSEVAGPALISFLNDYACPRCGAILSSEDAPTDCWLVCPECGRPREPDAPDLGPSRSRAINASDRSITLDALAEPTLGERLASLPYPTVLALILGVALLASLITTFALRAEPYVSGLVFLLVFPALAILFRPRRSHDSGD